VTPPKVFVLMPFHDEWRDMYEVGIKAACEEAGAECRRLDELIVEGGMVDGIYDHIDQATVLVAEMTEPNKNVYYEAGYAHGVGKPVIFLTRSADSIPFDLSQYQHVVHGGSITDLRAKLVPRLRHYLENPHEVARHRQHERMLQHIENYLRERRFERISFDGVRSFVNPAWTDEQLYELIDRNPDRIRYARMKGGKPGIKRLD
jgi:hypothetical protein